jgi:hypothetical protein
LFVGFVSIVCKGIRFAIRKICRRMQRQKVNPRSALRQKAEAAYSGGSVCRAVLRGNENIREVILSNWQRNRKEKQMSGTAAQKPALLSGSEAWSFIWRWP